MHITGTSLFIYCLFVYLFIFKKNVPLRGIRRNECGQKRDSGAIEFMAEFLSTISYNPAHIQTLSRRVPRLLAFKDSNLYFDFTVLDL